MAGKLEGKVALISGAARGQGRSHAVRLAQEGADIIAFDILEKLDHSVAVGATEADMQETVSQVEALDRRIHFERADVRDFDAVKRVVDAGVAEFGRLDIVSANAGVNPEPAKTEDLSDASFRETIDINLVGVWHTAKAAIPHIKAGGRGGSIILTSSDAGLFAMENIGGYVSSKHGVLGLMRTLALELGPHMIRVNSIHPTVVNTPMVMNEGTYGLFRPDLEHPTKEDMAVAAQQINVLPIPWVEPIDISNAVLFLASDDARYITGVPLPVDAGAAVK
jgi:(+)-trans-carveol dehydrogenase